MVTFTSAPSVHDYKDDDLTGGTVNRIAEQFRLIKEKYIF